MSRFAGPTLVASETGAKIPDWLRLAIAAVSGAALSLSFTGLYLGIYSWICVAALLLAVLGASGRVAFACGFFHALLFVVTSVPWIATVLSVHGGLPIAGGWGGLLRSEEHTSELQSLTKLVCRLLLEKKKTNLLVADDGISGLVLHNGWRDTSGGG